MGGKRREGLVAQGLKSLLSKAIKKLCGQRRAVGALIAWLKTKKLTAARREIRFWVRDGTAYPAGEIFVQPPRLILQER